ncbi:hypothetical protein EDC04DRAFT_173254 [Pisolithus marmoratus]|nr:hypothetical protein EDC04DRAFT_173254 [Pisolithus marmoratus]
MFPCPGHSRRRNLAVLLFRARRPSSVHIRVAPSVHTHTSPTAFVFSDQASGLANILYFIPVLPMPVPKTPNPSRYLSVPMKASRPLLSNPPLPTSALLIIARICQRGAVMLLLCPLFLTSLNHLVVALVPTMTTLGSSVHVTRCLQVPR